MNKIHVNKFCEGKNFAPLIRLNQPDKVSLGKKPHNFKEKCNS